MSNLGTSKVDDWKSLINQKQQAVYEKAAALKTEAIELHDMITSPGVDDMLTEIHGSDSVAKIAYKDNMIVKLQAANSPVTDLYNAVKPE